MSFLEKFRKHESDYDAQFRKMGIEFLDLYIIEENISFESLSEKERQILAVYFFGMAEGLRQKLGDGHDAEEMSHVIINCLIRVFKYSEEQAQSFFELIIDNLQSKDPENTDYVLIHRGLEGYFIWEAGNKTAVIDDVYEIIKVLNK